MTNYAYAFGLIQCSKRMRNSQARKGDKLNEI